MPVGCSWQVDVESSCYDLRVNVENILPINLFRWFSCRQYWVIVLKRFILPAQTETIVNFYYGYPTADHCLVITGPQNVQVILIGLQDVGFAEY